MLFNFCRVFLLLACLSSALSFAQEPVAQPSVDVEKMVETLNNDIRELQVLNDSLETSGKTEHNYLNYRLDERGFKLLKDFDSLVRQLVALPDGTPKKAEVIDRMIELSNRVGEAVFQRIEVIQNRINEAMNSLDSLSGGTLISARAYIQNMEDIRVNYYSAMASHIATRNVLGLSSEDIRARLEPSLYLYVETLAGRIEYTAAALKKVRTRLAADRQDAELKTAVSNLESRHRIDVSRLQSMISVLDRLKIDSSEYKTILLEQPGDFSVSFFSTTSLLSFVKNSWAKFKSAVERNSVDIVFRIIMFILILLVFRMLARMTRRVVRAAHERSSLDMSSLLKNMIESTSSGLVMGIGVLMALSQVGISLAPMLAGLGVAGFIVGFALQDTLGNFAAGAMILIYRPYDVDDFVEVTGASGLVKKMNLVSTTITTFDNQTLVIPNSKIWGDVIKNVTAQTQRRVDLEFGIGYSDDVEHAERILREIVEEHDMVLDDPEPRIKLHTLGDSSVNFVVRPWVKTGDYWDVYWDITREVKLRFDREGISIPFPQRDVHLYNETSSQD